LHLNADPNPSFHLMRIRTRILLQIEVMRPMIYRPSRVPFFAFKPPLCTSTALDGSILSFHSSRISTSMRIRIQLFILRGSESGFAKIMRIRVRNPASNRMRHPAFCLSTSLFGFPTNRSTGKQRSFWSWGCVGTKIKLICLVCCASLAVHCHISRDKER
jgi:hypothetical protein